MKKPPLKIIVLSLLLTSSVYGYYFTQRNLPHFHTIKDGVLYRSGQPRGTGLQYLRLKGIKTLINLRSPNSDGTPEEKEFAEGNNMNFHNIPLGRTKISMEESVKKFMDVVSDPSNWPVLVHCSRGKERSGLMSAVFRIEKQGWRNEVALAETFKLGLEPCGMPLVEDVILDHNKGDKLHLQKYSTSYKEVNWQE